MKKPLQILFLGVEPSPAVEDAARRKADKLDQFCPDVMSCRVTIEQVNKHPHQGRLYAVRLDVTVPSRELAMDRVQHEDVYVALRDAFDGMNRILSETARRRRGEEKHHEA